MKIKIIDYGYTKLPLRVHESDAGADIYACFKQSSYVDILPGDTVKIPLGLGLVLPDGHAAFVYPRSSIALKGVVCELAPIDSGYRGEIHAIVTNCGKSTYRVLNGDRIGQLVIMPIVLCDFTTTDCEQRGSGAFGSTGV